MYQVRGITISLAVAGALAITGTAGADEQTASSATSANPSRPSPNGRPGEWASDNDYPPAALRIGATGYVTFQISVADNGKPTACEVISSSKNADLDKATCDLMLKRARFIPATDAAGKHVAGTFRSSVRWQIPDGAPPLPAPSQFLVAYDVLPNGTVANCTVTVTGAVLTKVPENPQTLCVNLGPFAPPVDAHGKRIKKHVSAQNSTTVTDVP